MIGSHSGCNIAEPPEFLRWRRRASPMAGKDAPGRKCPRLCQGISLLVMQQGLRGERDHYTVIHFGDPRRRPGRFLGCLFLSIRTHRPPQDDLAALHFDRDTLGIRLRLTHQRLLDLLLEVAWQHTRLDHDELGDSFDPRKALYDSFCLSLLEAVFDLALERHPAAADRYVHLVS